MFRNSYRPGYYELAYVEVVSPGLPWLGAGRLSPYPSLLTCDSPPRRCCSAQTTARRVLCMPPRGAPSFLYQILALLGKPPSPSPQRTALSTRPPQQPLALSALGAYPARLPGRENSWGGERRSPNRGLRHFQNLCTVIIIKSDYFRLYVIICDYIQLFTLIICKK